jgi:hypothetical protein
VPAPPILMAAGAAEGAVLAETTVVAKTVLAETIAATDVGGHLRAAASA